jgi:prepilin-type N-terminal cleavage/methylation domain-containing protein
MQRTSNNNGFTLIEVLMAMAIISIGLLGVIALVNQNLNANVVNKNYLVASMLAQEGLELVRNRRDANWINSAPHWYDGLADGLEGIDIFAIDPSGLFAVNNIYDARLYRDGDGFFVHQSAGNSETVFFRLITIDDSNLANGYLLVISELRWSSKSGESSYIADTMLYDWR